MDDVKCPKCGRHFLRVHSILVPGATNGYCDVRYEWECGWCGHTEGNYENNNEAKKDYEKKYGGN